LLRLRSFSGDVFLDLDSTGYLGGLYLCGTSCHPGGNITGLVGYNCATVILNDLGLPSGAKGD
jgi:phytoene dehydrogenase-like protein